MKHSKQKAPMSAAHKSAKAGSLAKNENFSTEHPRDEHGRFIKKTAV